MQPYHIIDDGRWAENRIGAKRCASSYANRGLLDAGALVKVVAPAIADEIAAAPVETVRRPFEPSDLDGVAFVVAAAPPDVNRRVATAAQERGLFVNAVDDPIHASAFLSGVVRRDGITLAISTRGHAPALSALLKEALDALLPRDLSRWLETARQQRSVWRQLRVPMADRKPRLLAALNALYEPAAGDDSAVAAGRVPAGTESSPATEDARL